MRCIQALPRNAPTGNDDWFTFELNVKNWIQSHGYRVVHLTGNPGGDGGVDIQATRENENLLIQCKYWHAENVGPAVVRELIGALTTFPEGSRGVIITSNSLTEGARNLALDKGIEFIENVNFLVPFKYKI